MYMSFQTIKSQFLVIGLSAQLTQIICFCNLLLVLTAATLLMIRFL